MTPDHVRLAECMNGKWDCRDPAKADQPGDELCLSIDYCEFFLSL